jgi:hypothetical protein
MFRYSVLASLGLIVVVLLIRYVARFVQSRLSEESRMDYSTTNEIGDGRAVRKFTGIGQGLRYLFNGPELLRSCYAAVSCKTRLSYLGTDTAQTQGECFVIATPSNNHLMVTSREHIRELSQAPTHALSLHAVATEVSNSSCPRKLMLITTDASTETHHVRISMERSKRCRRDWFREGVA